MEVMRPQMVNIDSFSVLRFVLFINFTKINLVRYYISRPKCIFTYTIFNRTFFINTINFIM